MKQRRPEVDFGWLVRLSFVVVAMVDAKIGRQLLSQMSLPSDELSRVNADVSSTSTKHLRKVRDIAFRGQSLLLSFVIIKNSPLL